MIHQQRDALCEVGRPRGGVDRLRGEVDRPRGEVGRPRGGVDRPRSEVDRPRGKVNWPRGEVDRPCGGVDRPRGELLKLSQHLSGVMKQVMSTDLLAHDVYLLGMYSQYLLKSSHLKEVHVKS